VVYAGARKEICAPMTTESRIAMAEPPYSEEINRALERIMPPGVPPLGLFRALAVNERVFLRVMAGGLLDKGTISFRERELIINRTCFRCGSEYEWGVHVTFFGGKAKLSEDDVKDLCAADTSQMTSLSPADRLLMELCDQLHDTSTISDALWSRLAESFSPAQLVELVVLAGLYHMISFTTNALRVPLEAFAARFPTTPE
jgi:alkylhydroperoxidase family enzyme